jgi:hypothetical protein
LAQKPGRRISRAHSAFLCHRPKKKFIALAIIERARKKQRSRIANIKEGDANTKFFHLRVNARRRKNYIQRLKHNHGWVTDHGANAQVIDNHFHSVMGRGEARSVDFNWETLHFNNLNLESMDALFSEEEVRVANLQLTKCLMIRPPVPMGSPEFSSRSVGEL